MQFLKKNFFSVCCFLAMVIISFYYYSELPQKIVTQLGFSGSSVYYSDKLLALVFMPVLLGMLITFTFFAQKSITLKKMVRIKEKLMVKVVLSVSIMLLFLQGGIIAAGVTGEIKTLDFYFCMGISFFMLVFALFVKDLSQNFIVGIRTPWSLNSKENWKITHALTAKLMFGLGLISFVQTFLTKVPAVSIGLLLTAAIVPAIYSYIKR